MKQRIYDLDVFMQLFNLYIVDHWQNPEVLADIYGEELIFTVTKDMDTLENIKREIFDFDSALIIIFSESEGLQIRWNSPTVELVVKDVQEKLNLILDRYPDFWDAVISLGLKDEDLFSICSLAVDLDKLEIPFIFKRESMLKLLKPMNNGVFNSRVADC